ncbi:MAG: PIN domain-containing protein, partial [Alphaproteobacteria bacterium]|nr:PIN domain-containing protein [Alphaproteobacteria bacterium]
MILVDTNVLLDVVVADPVWAEWSCGQLNAAAARGEMAINDIVYAELSVGYSRIEVHDAMLAAAGLRLARIPASGLFLAGQAFRKYRDAGGRRTGVLPDLFIG